MSLKSFGTRLVVAQICVDCFQGQQQILCNMSSKHTHKRSFAVCPWASISCTVPDKQARKREVANFRVAKDSWACFKRKWKGSILPNRSCYTSILSNRSCQIVKEQWGTILNRKEQKGTKARLRLFTVCLSSVTHSLSFVLNTIYILFILTWMLHSPP